MSWIKRQLVKSRLRASGSLKSLGALEEAQWRNDTDLSACRDERRRRLLLHAARHVPFYREMLPDLGVVDGDGRVHLDRFTDIPLLEKRTIRERYRDLTSNDLAERRWSTASSGGSTGRPIRVIREDADGAELAIFHLFNAWAGQYPGDRHAVLWGLSRGLPHGNGGWNSSRARLSRWLNNYVLLDSYSVTAGKLRDHVARLDAWRPSYLQGYADFLYYLARFMDREDLAIRRPASIACTATPLYPHMRSCIERTFGAPVYDRYGSGEVGLVAAQCEQRSGLHVSVTTHQVEILRPDGTATGPGEIGEIVVTPLLNLAMPLLRYRTEDLGAWMAAPCPCGRAWPMLTDLVGRAIDVFVTGEGDLISGGLFIKLVDEINFATGDLIDRYQIVQEDYDRVAVRLVPRTGDPTTLPPAILDGIRRGVTATFPGRVEVVFEFPETIEAAPSGKFRFAISKVPRRARDFSDIFQV